MGGAHSRHYKPTASVGYSSLVCLCWHLAIIRTHFPVGCRSGVRRESVNFRTRPMGLVPPGTWGALDEAMFIIGYIFSLEKFDKGVCLTKDRCSSLESCITYVRYFQTQYLRVC